MQSDTRVINWLVGCEIRWDAKVSLNQIDSRTYSHAHIHTSKSLASSVLFGSKHTNVTTDGCGRVLRITQTQTQTQTTILKSCVQRIHAGIRNVRNHLWGRIVPHWISCDGFMHACMHARMYEHTRSTLLSPVMTITLIPAVAHSSMLFFTSGRGGSIIPTTPTNVMFCCKCVTYVSVLGTEYLAQWWSKHKNESVMNRRRGKHLECLECALNMNRDKDRIWYTPRKTQTERPLSVRQ